MAFNRNLKKTIASALFHAMKTRPSTHGPHVRLEFSHRTGRMNMSGRICREEYNNFFRIFQGFYAGKSHYFKIFLDFRIV